jgi:hypothetical protein
LAVENKNTALKPTGDTSRPMALRAFADTYDLGLVLDTTHAGTAGVDLVQARRTFDGRLVNVHLSAVGGRRLLARLPRMELVLREHRFPGAGELSLVPLLADLAAGGYDGPVTLEVNPSSCGCGGRRGRRHLARLSFGCRRRQARSIGGQARARAYCVGGSSEAGPSAGSGSGKRTRSEAPCSPGGSEDTQPHSESACP